MRRVVHEPEAGPRGARGRSSAVALGLLAGASVLFAALAVIAAQDVVPGWDRDLFAGIYSGEALRGFRDSSPGEGALDALLPFGWRLADPRTLGICSAALLVWAGWSRGARGVAFVALAVVPMAPLSRFIEQGLGRESPYAEAGVGSFPSGHAMVSAAVAFTALALMCSTTARRLVAAVGAGAVLAVGASVIADGGHWPSDVLGGWLLAAIWVAGAYALLLRPGGAGERRPAAATRHRRPVPSTPPAPADPAAARAHAP